MAIPVLVIGDTFEHGGTFLAGDPSAPYDVSGAQIKVAIVSPDHAIKFCDDVTLSIFPDYNRAEGRQLVRIPADVTAQIADYVQSRANGLVELQVDDGNSKYTWFSNVEIVRGQVA
jgi:hypothetical protein